MMTLDEMKLAVCEKLPELIEVRSNCCIWIEDISFRSSRIIHWQIEGLQVCHEAEKSMDASMFVNQYRETLYNVCGNGIAAINATYEQRLEALCRVCFPERFK